MTTNDVLAEEQELHLTWLKALTLINCVGPDGNFTDEAPEFVRGRWVKDCDKDIIRDLKAARPAVPPGAVSARLSRSAGGPKKIR